jgi:hypothetical protein
MTNKGYGTHVPTIFYTDSIISIKQTYLALSGFFHDFDHGNPK